MSIARKILMGAAGAGGSLPYVDDVFSTYVYKGTGATQTITNSIDVSGDGGLVWIKNRTLGDSYNFNLYDTERGATKFLVSNNSAAEGTNATGLDQFNNNGFRLGADSVVNASNKNFLSWTFRKAPGFFDVVSYTGNGIAGRTVAHNLESIPGMIIVKRTNASQDWAVYHRSNGATKIFYLNSAGGTVTDSDPWNDTEPTSSVFTVGTHAMVNANGQTYVAYIFAGGESTAATAVSVDFDGNDWLSLASNADLCPGTSDFTFEAWIYPTAAWSTSIFQGIYVNGYDAGIPGSLWIGNNPNSGGNFVVRGSSVTDYIQASYPPIGTWTHVAVTRSGSTLRLFYNGILEKSVSNSIDFPTALTNIGSDGSGSNFTGKISNLRFVKGTAVYTTSFRPPTEPLTNITNTKILCCQSSTTTTATVTPGTITANGDPTADTQSPFDDPEGFKFGENEDQIIIKCGTFVGNGNNSGQVIEGPMVDIGWEPSWVLTKATTVGEKWNVFSSMTTNGSGFINFVCPNETDWEGAYPWFKFNNRGFQPKISHDQVNANGQTYIYVAIRRPDGAVGKLPEVGTDAFAMDTGNSSGTIPNYDSTFPVDFAWSKKYSGSGGWYIGARLTGSRYMQTDLTSAQADAGVDNWTWDSNVGWQSDANYDSTNISHMWKRGAGFDVVAYAGNDGSGSSIQAVPHSLSKTPEMIWVKCRSHAKDWKVYHKGLNGGTTPEQYHLVLNSSAAELDSINIWNDTAPTSTYFTLFNNGDVNDTGKDYIAMLFASVDGISKVGSYTGTGSSGNSVSLGFQPRFLIVKNASWGSGDWFVYDTTRGWVSGNDSTLILNTSAAQVTGSTFDIDPTSTGFTVQSTDAAVNQNGHNFIYYAHA